MTNLIKNLRTRAHAITIYTDEDLELYNLLTEAANTVEGMRWIPVSEMLPEPFSNVLAWLKDGGYMATRYRGEVD